MQYLETLGWPTEFWLATALGCLATLLFAFDEFDRPTFKREPGRPETGFLPRELTNRRDYLISFVLYVVGLEVCYLTICIIGPAPMVELGLASGNAGAFEAAASFPLWVAIALIGIAPRIPFIAYIEQSWRRLMHERAAIPSAATSLARQMRSADFDTRHLRDGLRSAGEDCGLSSADFDADHLSTSYRWARLSALVWRLDTLEASPALEQHVSYEFIDRYRDEMDALRYAYRQLAERVRAARPSVAGKPMKPVPDELSSSIEAIQRRICLFLACALIAKTRREPIALGMQALGFSAVPEPRLSSDVDLFIQGFSCAVGVYFLTVFLALNIGPLLPESFASSGWPERRATDAFVWTFSAALMHGSALIGGLLVRRYLRKRHLWFRGTVSAPKPPRFGKYLLATAVACVVSLAAISYWDGMMRGANVIWSGLDSRYPFAFVAAASALFVCMILDRARTRAPRRDLVRLVLLQVLLTTMLAWIAGDHLYRHESGNAGAIAFTVLSAAIFAAVLGGTTAGRVQVEQREEQKRESLA